MWCLCVHAHDRRRLYRLRAAPALAARVAAISSWGSTLAASALALAAAALALTTAALALSASAGRRSPARR